MFSPDFSFVVHDYNPVHYPEKHHFTRTKAGETYSGTYNTYNDKNCALCEVTEKRIDYRGRKVLTFKPQISFFACHIDETDTYSLKEHRIEICSHCKPYIDGHEQLPSDLSALFIPGFKDKINYPENLKQAVNMNMFNMTVLLLDTLKEKQTCLEVSEQDFNDALDQSLLIAVKQGSPTMIRLLLDRDAELPINAPEARDAATLEMLNQRSGRDIDEKYASIRR